MSESNDVIIIDGKNFCYRNGWTHRDLRSGKQATGMLYGCITGLLRLQRLHPNAVIVTCWDGDKANKSWRHRLASNYKSNRNKKDVPQFVKDMRSQIPLFMSFLDLLGFKQFKVSSLEADDLIGILSEHIRYKCNKVLIYSTDRDFYQLIRRNVYVVRDQDKTKMCKPISCEEIFKEYGVYPNEWLKYRGIVGDAGDGILKPKGYGPKKALALLAAGVDVSTYRPTKKSGDFLHSKITDEDWNLMRLNYRLSKILKKVGEISSAKEVNDVTKFLATVNSVEDMKRTGKAKEVYEKMLLFLAKYQFEELMGRRKELWELL